MKLTRILLFPLLLIVNIAMAQDCPPGDLSFINQTQMNAFLSNYPNCTEIEGNVLIKLSEVTSLSGLQNIISIGGYLDLALLDLTNLSGLDNLISIGDYLYIVIII